MSVLSLSLLNDARASVGSPPVSPIGAAKGKQPNTEALCQIPPLQCIADGSCPVSQEPPPPPQARGLTGTQLAVFRPAWVTSALCLVVGLRNGGL